MRITGCFGKDKRLLKIGSILPNNESASKFYDFLLNERNSWIAHNHGSHFQVRVILVLTPDETAIDGHGILKVSHQGPVPAGILEVLKFTLMTLKELEKLGVDQEKVVLEEARALSSSEIKALPDSTINIPGENDLGKSRNQVAGWSGSRS